MALLETRGLSKSFGSQPIFEEVALQLEAGQALAIMGPSGAGKTTLLRCLNGLETADRGSLRVGPVQLDASDTPMLRHAALRALCRQVGFVFQGSHLFSHRTVLENVMEGPLYVQREAPAAARARAEALLERLEVLNRAAAYPRALSGGEQLQELNGTPNKATIMFIQAAPESDLQRVYQSLKDRYPQLSIVRTSDPSLLLADTRMPGLKEFRFTVVFVSMLLSFMVILLAMYTTIFERTREIGILKSLGASRAFIIARF